MEVEIVVDRLVWCHQLGTTCVVGKLPMAARRRIGADGLVGHAVGGGVLSGEAGGGQWVLIEVHRLTLQG
jgi:hypothetical protein